MPSVSGAIRRKQATENSQMPSYLLQIMLGRWLRQHRTGALSCPTCRTVTECPNNDIDSLPSNLFYKQMVEIVEAYTGQEESSCCGNCDEQKSLRFTVRRMR